MHESPWAVHRETQMHSTCRSVYVMSKKAARMRGGVVCLCVWESTSVIVYYVCVLVCVTPQNCDTTKGMCDTTKLYVCVTPQIVTPQNGCVTPQNCTIICRVGQNRIYTPYMTVFLVISLPKIPYIHRINMVLANPNYYMALAHRQTGNEQDGNAGCTTYVRVILNSRLLGPTYVCVRTCVWPHYLLPSHTRWPHKTHKTWFTTAAQDAKEETCKKETCKKKKTLQLIGTDKP
jgi:hypothetical protein